MVEFGQEDRDNITKCVTLLESQLIPVQADHETRVRKLETGQAKLMTLAAVFSAGVGLITSKWF